MAYEFFLKKMGYEHSKVAKFRFQSRNLSMYNDIFPLLIYPNNVMLFTSLAVVNDVIFCKHFVVIGNKICCFSDHNDQNEMQTTQ